MKIDLQNLIARGALFVANHSGGKDSQAQLIKMLEMGIPTRQIVVMHATLGEFEWEGALEIARDHAKAAGIPFVVARAIYKDGSEKNFLNRVEYAFARRPEAPSFPSRNCRYCTSELKTGPIEREIRRYAKEHGFTLIVNCLGERAQESDERKNRAPFRLNVDNSKAGREWYDWLPIHDMLLPQVWATIAGAGMTPHPAYAAGNERLSCVFCFYGSKGDLARGAKAYPDLFRRYVEMEERTGYTLHMDGMSLTQLVEEAAR